jgi:general secretion pathway protein B
MSYILDALRRADAERERGGVPGLHTQPALPAGDDDDPGTPARGLRAWHWVVLGLAGGLAVALAWQWPGSEAPPTPMPAPPPMPMTAAPAVEPAPAPAPVVAPRPATVPVPMTAQPATPVEIAPMRATPKPAPAAATTSAASPSPAAAATATTPTRVGSLAELPADARRGLPPLAFGGSIYSNTPANRLLIVNGQLMHEGDSLGPDTTLEQIKPKAAVLNIRGQRFEIGL